MSNFRLRAFTLIELLIVVAIIAILAAIAVPNFLEAQTRAKVSRVKSDLRTQSVALEAYFVDNNRYTRDSDSDLDITDSNGNAYHTLANGAVQLTTPIAYMTSMLADPFAAATGSQVTGGTAIGYRIGSGTWNYDPAALPSADSQGSETYFGQYVGTFVTLSPGPGKRRQRMGYKCFPFRGVGSESNPYIDYDPTNGTISSGDIYRFGGSFLSGNWDRTTANRGPQGPAAF
jgi:prepilin-type N-terminal cleavage/methylation domain-containing protein